MSFIKKLKLNYGYTYFALLECYFTPMSAGERKDLVPIQTEIDGVDSAIEFVKVLVDIDKRISRLKEPSNVRTEPNVSRASIDKIELKTFMPFQTKGLIGRANLNGFKFGTNFGNGRQKFMTFHKRGGLIRVPYFENTDRLITNPSEWKLWSEYMADLKELVSFDLEQISITRLDLAVDFECDFREIADNIHPRNIKSEESFKVVEKTGTKNTGVMFGVRPRQVQIYDYTEKHRCEKQITRVEERLYTTKVPTKKLNEIPVVLTSPAFEFFKNLELCYHSVPENLVPLSAKAAELKTLMSQVGFRTARTTLNVNDNFKRDYQKFLDERKFNKQLNEIFREQIQDFFV